MPTREDAEQNRRIGTRNLLPGFLHGKGLQSLVACLLVAATLVVYGQIGRHGFLHYDDDQYVTENPVVRSGLTVQGVAWALTTTHFSYWHPLTWISHMTDVEVFGLDARAHHFVSLSFHAANAVLLFMILFRMTGALWQSGFVAALFALHPLHVESVAWLAERKDLLSTFFWLLAIGAYLRYVRRPGVAQYLVVLLLFMLGLMAKPMVVTLPVTLLLLDYWPLQRLSRDASPPDSPGNELSARRSGPHILGEKIPFVLLSVACGVITLLSPGVQGASSSLERLPLNIRGANALVAAAGYLGKTIWPSSLAVYYPHHEGALASWKIAGAAALVGGITILVLRMARRRPYLVFGWFWYLTTLLPVSGLIQVGGQSMADRYTYVPLIGIFVMISWGVADMASSWRLRAPALAATAFVALFVLAFVSWRQAAYWQDDRTLFSHAIDVTSDNYLAELNLGVALERGNKVDEAIPHYTEALRIRPFYADAHYNLAVALGRKGRINEAALHYGRVLQIRPRDANAHNNLGFLLFQQGRLEEAIAHYQEAIRINPRFALAQSNLGSALGRQGKIDEAVVHFRAALRDSPDDVLANYNLGIALMIQGKKEEAAFYFQEALRRKPGDPAILKQLEQALSGPGK
ncbi:MAG: tetratricopeptide repeat protein [Candidatus Deferrimicrobiaceae bacterium]